jgi:hypothetical protein
MRLFAHIRRHAETRFCPRRSIAQFTARMPHPAGASKSRIYKIGLMAYLSLRRRFSCSLGPAKARMSHQHGGPLFLPRYRHVCLEKLRSGGVNAAHGGGGLGAIGSGGYISRSTAAGSSARAAASREIQTVKTSSGIPKAAAIRSGAIPPRAMSSKVSSCRSDGRHIVSLVVLISAMQSQHGPNFGRQIIYRSFRRQPNQNRVASNVEIRRDMAPLSDVSSRASYVWPWI